MQLGLCLHPSEVADFNFHPFDFIEGHVWKFLCPEKPAADFAEFRAAMLKSRPPMPAANCFLPPDLKVTGPGVDFDRLSKFSEIAFARAREVGISLIVYGSAGARMMPEGWSATQGFEQYVESLKLIAPIAQRHGVTIVVEPLNRGECNLVNTLDEGAEATLRCGHPNVRLLVDIFHMLRNGEAPDAIARHADLIVHAHVAENKDRAEPGVNGDDFRPFFKLLKKAHRCRRLTLECVWSGDLYQKAGPALQELRRQWTDAV